MRCRLKGDESNVDLDFDAAECTAKPGHIHVRGKKQVGCFSAWLGAGESCVFYFITQS